MDKLIFAFIISVTYSTASVLGGDVDASAIDYGIPSNVVVYNGETHEYEGRDTLHNNGNVTFNLGSVGLISAGDSISIYPGFYAKDGSDVSIFIDSNFNGVSDFRESLDADGDGYYDELEAILGTSSEIGVVGFETDIDGDGIFDKIVDVAHGGTASNYMIGEVTGLQGLLTGEYEVFGFYNYYQVSYMGMGFSYVFYELPDYLNINFYVTYSYFDLIGFYYNTYFPTESGVEYELQSYVPGAGWQVVQRIMGSGGQRSIDLPALYPQIKNIVDFVRLVVIGKAIVNDGGGGSNPIANSDSLTIEGVGEVVGDVMKVSIPEVIGISQADADELDWDDERPIGSTTPWEIDLNGDGSSDVTLDPLSQSGKVSVPILGKIVEITYEEGSTSIGLGKYKVTRSPSGTFSIELPDDFTGGDGKIKLTITQGPGTLFIPDYNRDGMIDGNDVGYVDVEHPWRRWINDDDDSPVLGQGDDIPERNNPDHANSTVDGLSDLEDFFPLKLNIKKILDDFWDKGDYSYFLKQSDGALNMVRTVIEHDPNLSEPENELNARAKAYLKRPTIAPRFESSTVEWISADGVELSQSYLQHIQDDTGGVVLIEGKSETTNPLVLEIRKRGESEVVASYDFPISFSGIEKMFRLANLVGHSFYNQGIDIEGPGPGDSLGRNSRSGSPANWPDDELPTNNTVIHVHGFTISQQKARSEHTNDFKRLFHAGSQSRFIGLNWNAEVGYALRLDYYQAVVNAFLTSSHIDSFFQLWELDGSVPDFGEVTVIAHSLGNMLVSNAIERYGFRPDNYVIVNGAVAIEAYAPEEVNQSNENAMKHESWLGYQDRFLPTRWHELFESSSIVDHRRDITWSGVFENVKTRTNVYNFYSSGESVVENPGRIGNNYTDLNYNVVKRNLQFWNSNIDKGRTAWVGQEVTKGYELMEALMWASHAGWGLPLNPSLTVSNPKYWNQTTDLMHGPLEPILSTITEEELRIEPFFRKFENLDREHPGGDIRFVDYKGDDLYGPLGDATASNVASKLTTRYKLLAECVPSKSFAVATNSVSAFQDGVIGNRNFDMNSEFNVHGWITRGSESGDGFGDDWWHSDIWSVPFVYTQDAFEKIVELEN